MGGKAVARVPPRVHQYGGSSNPILLGFYGGFNTEVGLTKALATAVRSHLQSLSLPRKSGQGWKVPKLQSLRLVLWPPATTPPTKVLSNGHLIYINPGVV